MEEMKLNTVICGDCLEIMRNFEDNSIDTIITDPPYGIGFMGKEWDNFKPSQINGAMARDKRKHTQIASQRRSNAAGTYDLSPRGLRGFQQWMTEIAIEMLRVAKPGATFLCFGGTRTYHRLACAVEDAGWILKDCIMWLYGSGFPKATDISKQLDKMAGVEQELEEYEHPQRKNRSASYSTGFGDSKDRKKDGGSKIMRGIATSKEAKLWNGWKSHGLKPAYEPILVAMKPNEGSYAENALKHGVAGLNIDGGRIPIELENEDRAKSKNTVQKTSGIGFTGNKKDSQETPLYDLEKGRFPSNLILDPEAGKILDEQSGDCKTGGRRIKTDCGKAWYKQNVDTILPKDSGSGASRFFYCAKSSKAERNMGCEGLEIKKVSDGRQKEADNAYQRGKTLRSNTHPTVKPLKLMEYLCILTKTPTGGIVLDPFAGSGTTGLACQNTDRDYVLIEKEKEYCEIARARLNANKNKARQGVLDI